MQVQDDVKPYDTINVTPCWTWPMCCWSCSF